MVGQSGYETLRDSPDTHLGAGESTGQAGPGHIVAAAVDGRKNRQLKIILK